MKQVYTTHSWPSVTILWGREQVVYAECLGREIS